MKCPYCGHGIEKKTEFSLSFKKTSIYKFIIDGGQEGVWVKDVIDNFIESKNDATLRSHIYYINEKIKPNQIVRPKGSGRIMVIGED